MDWADRRQTQGGFFASIAPTFYNQAGIAGILHNLHSARGTIIQETRSGSLKILSDDAGKALDETKEVTTDLNPVWQTFQGMGTALSIAGGWFPLTGAVRASVQLVGILGQNFAPRSNTPSTPTHRRRDRPVGRVRDPSPCVRDTTALPWPPHLAEWIEEYLLEAG